MSRVLRRATALVAATMASLVFVTFGGTRRDKLIAHLELAAVGSIVLMIGTAVSGTAWLAAIVTLITGGQYLAQAAGALSEAP